MRPLQKLTPSLELVFRDRFTPVWILVGSVSVGLFVAWLTLKNPAYSWLGMGFSLVLSLGFVTLCCLILMVLNRRRALLRYQWAPDQLLRRDGFGFLVWFLAHNGLVVLAGSALAFFMMWGFGPETWVIAVIAAVTACTAVALWGVLFPGRRSALALCWSLPMGARDLGFFDLNKALFLPSRFGMAVDLDRRTEFPLLCDVARILDLKGAAAGQRNLSLWDGGFAGFGSEIWCRVKVLSTVFGFTLLITFLLLIILPTPKNRPWLGPLDGFGTPFSRAALAPEVPPGNEERQADQNDPASKRDAQSQDSKQSSNAAMDSQSDTTQPNSEAGDSEYQSQNTSSDAGNISESAAESGEKRSGEKGSQGETGNNSQSESQPGDTGEGGSEGDNGPQSPGQSGAPGDEGEGNQGNPGGREGGSKPDPDKQGTGTGEAQSQSQEGGNGPPAADKKGEGSAEGSEQNPGSGESQNGNPSGADPSKSESSQGNETGQGMGSSAESEGKGSGGEAGESAGENAPSQDGQSEAEGDPSGSVPQSGRGGKSSSPGTDDHTPLMADPSQGGGDGPVRVAFPPAGDEEMVTLELPPMGEQPEAAQDTRRATGEKGETRRGKQGEFGDEPFSPAQPGARQKTAKPVQHLPNWVRSLLPETRQRRKTP